jgi:hypothetical protein
MLPLTHTVDRTLAKQIVAQTVATLPCGDLFFTSPVESLWIDLKNVHLKKLGASSYQCQTLPGRPDLHFFKVAVAGEIHTFAFFADGKTSLIGSSLEVVLTDSSKRYKPLTPSQKAAGQALVNYLNALANDVIPNVAGNYSL